MSFPINICCHNENDLLSWKIVFYHVIIAHLHWQISTALRLPIQCGQWDFQYLNNDF